MQSEKRNQFAKPSPPISFATSLIENVKIKFADLNTFVITKNQRRESPVSDSKICPRMGADENYSDAITGYDEMGLFESSNPSRRFTLIRMGIAAFLIVFVIVMSITSLAMLSKNTKATEKTYNELLNYINNGGGSGAVTSSPDPPELCSVGVAEDDRFDCHPDNNANSDQCLARGCCWNETRSNTNIPFCYFPTGYQGYKVASAEEGPDCIVVNLERQIASGFPKDIKYVRVEITTLDEHKLRIKIDDPTAMRFEVTLPPLNNIPDRRSSSPKMYRVEVSKDGLLQVARIKSGVIIFNVDLQRLVFSDQFIQLTNKVGSRHLYGLGEHKGVFRKEVTWKRYTMLNSDRMPTENEPLYGTHPFYIMQEDDSRVDSHGVLLFNNNPQDIILQPTPAVTYRTIGGVLDFYIYLGPTPQGVVAQHIELVGKPQMPPLWGLGFHLCRYGYNSLDNTNKTMMRNIEAGVPLDVQWNDIDYMDEFNDYTYDKVKFAGLPEFVDSLHERGMKWVPIVDPAVSASETPGKYDPFDDGVLLDIFIKNSTDELYVGKVWNTKTSVWPDFTNPKVNLYWAKECKEFYQQVKFDGIWIDMNEPSNVYNGNPDGCEADPLNSPPYLPGGQPLEQRTLCATAKHYEGRHYDVHNMYGIYEAKATQLALLAIRDNKRPFIISRSSATGMGCYGSHWTGDIYSSFDHMKFSIPSLLNFNLFGIPLVGADICGFGGDTTVELCARWQAMGAFYPFSRNHNTNDAKDQDPAALGEIVVNATVNALEMRYSLLPFLYTLFYDSASTAKTVMRSFAFEWPLDKNAVEIEDQFLWGSDLMINPVVYADALKVNAYFPPGRWYNYKTKKIISDSKDGQKLDIDVPITEINVAVRGGSVLPTQAPQKTTTAQRDLPFNLHVALDSDGKAKGKLFWDDGDSMYSMILETFSLVYFDVADNTLTTTPTMTGWEGPFKSTVVTVLGVPSMPSKATVDGKDATFEFDGNDVLTISNFEIDLNARHEIKWTL